MAHSKNPGGKEDFEGGEIGCDVSRSKDMEGGHSNDSGSDYDSHEKDEEDHSHNDNSANNNGKVQELKNGKLVPINHVHLKTFAARSANIGKKKQRK